MGVSLREEAPKFHLLLWNDFQRIAPEVGVNEVPRLF
jgi:hypothetical protein